MRILPTSPNPKPTMSNPDQPSPPPDHHHSASDHPPTISSPKQPSSSRARLLKIPPIAFRRISKDDNDNEDDDDKASKFKDKYRDNNGDEEDDDSTPLIMASNLGLNNIRTRSSLSPLPLSTPATAPVNHGSDSSKVKSTVESRPKPKFSDEGKRVQWHSKSLRNPSPRYPVLEGNHAAFAKEMHSPRFQAILCVTSGRKKGGPDIKSFSHELNSKGVRPFPVWKSRALGHMEEIMVAIREKFDRLKEEVNSDLGAFAGDLVGLLENTSEPHPEWRESLEDLLIVARHCAKMRPSEFWFKCEGIVQNLDDRRQELTVGVLKQAHTRLLFILTRCTRLVQFQKESGYEEERILGLHQLSDLGVYPDQILEAVQQNICGPPSGKDVKEKHTEKPHREEQGQATDIIGLDTAKSLDSSSGSCKMSSWKKLPCASGKKKKGSKSTDTQSSEKSDPMHGKGEDKSGSDYNAESMEIPPCHPVHSEAAGRVPIESSANWGYHPNVHCESLMICRICEVEIPTVHVEEHSRICTIVDRCDLKGLTVNERLDRVAETLKKIMEYWTPRSTPKGSDVPRGSFDAARVPVNCTHEVVDESPKRNNCYHRCPKDMLTCVPDANNVFINDDLNVLPDMSCEAHSTLVHDSSTKSSSERSLTPRSPLLTPLTSQIELLLSGCRIISELESYQQIQKLLDIVCSVANINNYDYSALECMLERIGELKYAIQDRKVDALIVETFGRRIEKLLQEKYVHLCGQIEDERVDSLNGMADEESSLEEDTVRSLRASPINVRTKDRTSIEDFEIIKPISRGAFGRVFLAKKRSTGDLFAIKVLKKADMIRKNAVESILAERNILISVRNPFVVRFFYSFTCRENLYLVMEYLNGGDLYSLLRNVGSLDEDVTRVYIAEVVLALEYLHSVNIIHRDLKPDNLVIGQDGHVKLTDFGLSKVGLINSTDDFSGPSVSVSTFLGDDDAKSQHSSKREQRQKHSVVGTPDYLAPEILLGTGHGAAADWWSVGVILYELLVGVPPFNAEHPQRIFNNIINRDISWPKVPEEISYEAYDLINKLLTENPGQRLGATGSREVKQHSFFRDINWDTLEQQKAMFIPSADTLDTSYFESRYIWNPEDEHVNGGSDFDDMTDTCSSGSYVHDEDGDECGSLADFNPPTLAVQYSFSNFSFKNLSQLASINYDMVVKSAMESPNVPKPAIP